MKPGTVRVRIGSTIVNEYVGRSVFWELPDGPGTHEVPVDTAREMLADAEFYTDKDGPDETPANIKQAYARLRDQLRKVLA